MNKFLKSIVYFGILAWLLVACQSHNKEQAIEAHTISYIKIERYGIPNENIDSMRLSSYIIKEFDAFGKESRSIYYNSADSIMMQFENSYTDGNKTRVIWRNRNNRVVRYVNMAYNSDNKIAKSESYKPDGSFIEGYTHRWTDNYRIEEKGPINDSIFQPNSIYTYTEFDEFESLTEFDLVNDSLYGRFQWNYTKFDAQKNWLEREVLFNNKLTRLEKRTIKYND